MLISQEGYYKGIIVDGGVNESPGGYPQAALALRAEEIFDMDTQEWVAADAEACEMNYWGVLFGSGDKETANCKQIKKILEWDGADFYDITEFIEANPSTPIQFRVEWNTYKDDTKLKVTWVDPIGASPQRGVAKLDKAETKALSARYASVLAATKAPAKATSAKGKAKAAKKTKPKAAPKQAPEPEVTEAAADPTPPSSTASTRPGKPKPPKAPKPSAKADTCTADEAWDAAAEGRRKDVDDDQLSEVWLATIAELAPNGMESMLTGEGWHQVKEAVLAKVG